MVKPNKHLQKWIIQVGLLCTMPAFADISTELQSEVSYHQSSEDVNKAETTLRTEWHEQMTANATFTLIPIIKVDLQDDLHGDEKRAQSYADINGPWAETRHNRFELAEAFSDIDMEQFTLRLGKQQVVWGQADGLKVLDVINPQNYREFNLPDFDDSRIPTWMLNTEFRLAENTTAQLLIIPDMTFNELADRDTTFNITSPELAPQPNPAIPVTLEKSKRPDDGELETGFRFSTFAAGWDLTANYFYYFQDSAVIYRDLGNTGVTVAPEYKRSQLYGLTASNAFADWVLRFEIGYVKDNYYLRNDLVNSGIQVSDELSSVTGIDYHGFSDILISYQFFQSSIQDYAKSIIRHKDSIKHTLMFKQNALNDTLELRLFALLNRDYNDGQLRGKVSMQIDDDWQVWGSVDNFFGDKEGPFGEFKKASLVSLGFATSF
jgi:hypothetical protein